MTEPEKPPEGLFAKMAPLLALQKRLVDLVDARTIEHEEAPAAGPLAMRVALLAEIERREGIIRRAVEGRPAWMQYDVGPAVKDALRHLAGLRAMVEAAGDDDDVIPALYDHYCWESRP